MTRRGERAGSAISEHTIGRRTLLIFTGAAGLALAGCTGSPPDPGPGRQDRPIPKPKPLPGTGEAAATESKLADYADALLSRQDKKLDDDQQRLLAQLRDAHRAHVAVLTSTTPFDLPQPSPSPSDGAPSPTASTAGSASPSGSAQASGSSPVSGSAPAGSPSATKPSATPTVTIPDSPASAIKKLAGLEAAASTKHRKRALKPTGPEDQLAPLSLLWGSLSVAADSYGRALTDHRDPAAAATGQQRVAIALPDPTAAAIALLEQCYAIIFGYQTALAKLSGARGDHARSTLSHYRDLRDRLVADLVGQDQKPPAPHAAYKLPTQPTSSAKAAQLIGSMETAMLPFLGQWLATTDDRPTALNALINSSRDNLAWTSMIMVWPGWPTQD